MQHVSHRGNRLDEALGRNKKLRRDRETGAAGGVIDAVIEQSNRALVLGMSGVSVERSVELWARREQADGPDAQCAKQSQPALSWFGL